MTTQAEKDNLIALQAASIAKAGEVTAAINALPVGLPPVLHRLTGTVALNGTGLPGVTILGVVGASSSPVTDGMGAFVVSVNDGWTGTLTPQKTGYTFSPVNRTFANVTADQGSVDFAAAVVQQVGSPDRTECPPAASVTEANGKVWSLGAPAQFGNIILLNGAAPGEGGQASLIAAWHGVAWFRNSLGDWYTNSGGSWVLHGKTPPY